jgi:hypothetical protein
MEVVPSASERRPIRARASSRNAIARPHKRRLSRADVIAIHADVGAAPKTRIITRQRAVQRADLSREAAILATPSRARVVGAG